MEKFGCVFSGDEMKILFDKHSNRDGRLNYDNFASCFNKMGAGTTQNFNHIHTLLLNPPNAELLKMREVCLS